MANFLGRAMRHPFSADNEAMIRLAEHPKTRDFARSLDYADLPRGWADNPEIIRLANDAYRQVGIDSPFFQAWYRGSRLVDAQGNPVVMYHGSPVRGLRTLDPDASRLVPAGQGSVFAAGNPVTALSYVSRPDYRLDDPQYQLLRRSVADALRSGKEIRYPSRWVEPGELDVMRIPPGMKPEDALVQADIALRDAAALDWKLNSGRLGDSYEQALPGYSVPRGALESAVSQHLAHDLLLEANERTLGKYGDWSRGAFSDPVMGEIYPVYVKARSPFIVEGIPGKYEDWVHTGRMRVDKSSLTPDELAQAERNRSLYRGYTSPPDVYPDVDYSRLPTDNLSGWLRQNTDHDALLSKGVTDGGGAGADPTDVAAVHSARQLKSTRNIGTFFPGTDDMFRGILPYAAGGGALAAAMGAPSSASAAVLPSGWVPPSAKAELQGMEPEGWMDPIDRIVDVSTAGGGAAARALAAAGGLAQDWAMEHIPAIPEIPEEYREAAQ